MSITLGTGFHIGSKDLIYDKFVLSKDEMLNINENTYPDQFFALCSDDNKLYTFDINNTPNSTTGKFIVVSGDGSSSLTSEQIANIDKIPDIETQVTTNTTDITELQEQVDAIETNLATLVETSGMLDNILG